MENKIFYLTFGQRSPAKNGWIEVHASDYRTAREKVFKEYERQWSMLYPESDFEKETFPAGCLGVLK